MISNYIGPNDVDQFIIPENLNIKVIETNCFKDLHATSIHIPSTVREIQKFTFYNSVIDSLIIADGITTINDCAFYQDDKNKITYLQLPTTLKKIRSMCRMSQRG